MSACCCTIGSLFEVHAGPHERENALVSVPCAEGACGGSHVVEQLGPDGEVIASLPGQCAAPAEGEAGHLTVIVPALAAGAVARLRVRDAAEFDPAQGVTIVPEETHYHFFVRGRHLTSYVVDPRVTRPFCYPLLGPGEVPLTRPVPAPSDAPDWYKAPSEHPHHKGLYVAQGDVNGFDNWSEEPGHARTVNRACQVRAQGPVYAELLAENDWVSPAGDPFLAETTLLRVYNLPGETRLLDWDLTWRAAYGGVFFGDTKEAGTLSVRMAESLRVDHGGRMVNAYGGVGEGECWGQPAPWVDYSGLSEGRHVGLAILDHPSNFRYPTTWHVRDYGLFTANCWGRHDFTGDWSVRGDYALPAGQALHWTFRVVLHEGDEQEGQIARRWLDFAYPPRVGGG